MTTTAAKTGRKHKFHTFTGDNLPVVGLCRDKDGRWRIALGQGHPLTGHRFTEADERRAIARFRELTGKSAIKQTITPAATVEGNSSDATLVLNRVGVSTDVKTILLRGYAIHETGTESMPINLDCPEIWAFVRQQIIARPLYVAAQTGIEQIGYLDKVREPAGIIRMADVVEHYAGKSGLSPAESGAARRMWREFIRLSGTNTLQGITHDAVKKYETKIAGEGLAPKSIRHRYAKIKTVLAYAMRRGVDAIECRRALDVLAMLEMPAASPLAPHPISVSDFWKIHRAAVKVGDTAFAAAMLVMLNCCMYPSEVAALTWENLNLATGELVMVRNKTRVARVAMLWPETIGALKALPCEREEVFHSDRRSYTAVIVLHKWENLREVVSLPDTKPSDIRDAAYTYACRTVSLDKAKILAGHRLSGSTDHYVQRNPGFVKDACEAIRKAFAVAKNIAEQAKKAKQAKGKAVP